MNINLNIVDQRLNGLVEDHPEWLPDGNDFDKKKSAAFVLLSVSSLLERSLEEAADMLTDGGNDMGIDGLHIGEIDDGEFTVCLFQGKYSKKENAEEKNFPEAEIRKTIPTVAILFDPSKHVEMNENIAPKVEEIRSLVRDGYIPNVRVICCNNGKKWNRQAQKWIDEVGFPPDQVSWSHFNHDDILSILRSKKPVDDSITLSGEAVLEDFNFRRVLIGKIPVNEIGEIFNRHGDRLLERNIRRYLGLRSNRVNSAIHDTLMDETDRNNFYFFNNGITIICNKFRHNALQAGNFQVKLEGMQIINGGQTCKTIQKTLQESDNPAVYSDVYVMVRIYELEESDSDFVRDITYATNSQNPVDLRDLRSNDEIQHNLEIGMADLGYTYKRQRDESSGGSNVITSSTVAEAVLAVWRYSPHQAKSRKKEHFGKLYDLIFKDLNAAQAILSVLIFRHVENERKRPSTEEPPSFLPYASHYMALVISILMLGHFLRKRTINSPVYDNIKNNNFNLLHDFFEAKKHEMYIASLEMIRGALTRLYGEREISLQQLAATFRRGDLLDIIIQSHISKKK